MKKYNLDILFEDNHLIIVNKKSSEIVQGDKSGDSTLGDKIKAYLVERYNKPGEAYLGVVHRLDRPVSGAVIFAKTSKALTRMNEIIKEGQLSKKYWAIVENRPEIEFGHLTNYLQKNEQQNKSYVVKSNKAGAKLAELNYQLILSGKNYHLLEVELLTGRHHQIRVQLSHMGSVIKGDLKYGASRSTKDGSIYLHAHELEFIHPVTKSKINIIAPPPSDEIWKIFNR